MSKATGDFAKSLIIIDDDAPLRDRLAKSMIKRGFSVMTADSLAEARCLIRMRQPNYAIVDLKLGDGYGLDIVREIRLSNDQARIVIVTGYGNIASAIAAIKFGAVDYLPKPADVDSIERTLMNQIPTPTTAIQVHPMSPDRVRWEHIQRIFTECDNNVSETARRLQMHRRTLQRILAKHAPKM